MSVKERRRLEVMSRVEAQEVSVVQAAELLGLSYRQAKRSLARYWEQGDAGLVHRLRGRASNRHKESGRRERALELYREQYSSYGPTPAAEPQLLPPRVTMSSRFFEMPAKHFWAPLVSPVDVGLGP